MLPPKQHVVFAVVSSLSTKMLLEFWSQGGMIFIWKDLKHWINVCYIWYNIC